MILNITKDHLDWHETIKNYIILNLKFFAQRNSDYSYINSII